MGLIQDWHRRSIDREVSAEIRAKVSEQVGREREECRAKVEDADKRITEAFKLNGEMSAALKKTSELVRAQSEADAVLASVRIILAVANGAKASDIEQEVRARDLMAAQMNAMDQMKQLGQFQRGWAAVLPGQSLLGSIGGRLL